MSYRWSFEPEEEIVSVREAYQPIIREKKPKANAWAAPEHLRLAKDMRRDYDRNDLGERIGDVRNLKIDKRPTIMVPPRPTRPAPPI